MTAEAPGFDWSIAPTFIFCPDARRLSEVEPLPHQVKFKSNAIVTSPLSTLFEVMLSNPNNPSFQSTNQLLPLTIPGNFSFYPGFLNFNVMRSLSPMAEYFSLSPERKNGGNDQAPLGWSAVSLGFALTSLAASNVNPAWCAISLV